MARGAGVGACDSTGLCQPDSNQGPNWSGTGPCSIARVIGGLPVERCDTGIAVASTQEVGASLKSRSASAPPGAPRSVGRSQERASLRAPFGVSYGPNQGISLREAPGRHKPGRVMLGGYGGTRKDVNASAPDVAGEPATISGAPRRQVEPSSVDKDKHFFLRQTGCE